LSIDKDGYIVDSNGSRLLACNFQGDLAYIKENGNEIEFLEDGSMRGVILDSEAEELRELDNLVVNLSDIQIPRDMVFIREFTDLKDLQQEGNNYFYIESEDEIVLSEASKIHQGFLEGSNVNIVKEMVEMINVSRLYETNQKMLTSQEETLTKADEISKWT
jgi:flagellar basal-body rod protein FlgG